MRITGQGFGIEINFRPGSQRSLSGSAADTTPADNKAERKPLRFTDMPKLLLACALLTGCATARRHSVPVKVPTTQQESQGFVERWNEYARDQHLGIVSMEKWQKVVDAWRRMTE